ncbi:hypothetical protein MXM31_12860 [Klebsiella aerogenes]|uniref:hypothetical protein n=1 Tax=Klebsiella aerogenes TaxID=548 RepID=UPI002DB6C4BF|nr:hypothetical protein [Klebsiella aerogenes]MEB5697056.1 hypothetical protein [Klebsiella aerogenes]
MSLGRLLYHACWYALLGPFLGVFAAIFTFGLFDNNNFTGYLIDILPLLPILIMFGYFWGAVPAFLTGAMVACLPGHFYFAGWQRILLSGATGASLAFCSGYLLFYSGPNIFSHPILWVMCCAGLFSGMVMGWLIIKISYAEELPIRKDIEP